MSFKEAWLQHGKAGEPMVTEEVTLKEEPLPHHERGLSYTATGYGSKIPTRFKVRYGSRWYRVYSACFSNVSTEYIVTKGEQLRVTIH